MALIKAMASAVQEHPEAWTEEDYSLIDRSLAQPEPGDRSEASGNLEHVRLIAERALIPVTKLRFCSCCGGRFPSRNLSEVTEDDELLGWFVGDLLCDDCIRAGYWS